MHRSRKRPPRPTHHRNRLAATGVLHVREGGRASVECESGTYIVASRGIREAMNGDTVAISLAKPSHGERLAYVQSVIERGTTTLLCRYEDAGPIRVLIPLDARIHHDFFLPEKDDSDRRLGVQDQDIVRARILEYPARRVAGTATIERRIGAQDEIDVGMESILATYDLPQGFPAIVEAEAASLVPGVEEALAADPARKDLRGVCVATIDPADAKDYDDAVGGWRTPEGYEILVCIADVTHYVTAESSIDLEARRRTCSVYLADRVIPMLPEALSNGVCSLVPREDRLAMAVRIGLDRKGRVLYAKPCKAAIRSRARLAYDEADAFLAGEAPLPEAYSGDEELEESLRVLDEVARLRIRVRERRGALDFPSREAKVVLDGEGHPVGVRIRTKTRATSLVEEAMLLANETVAKLLADHEVACAYRVHEAPLEEKLEALVPIFKELDLFGSQEEVLAFTVGDPYALAAVLERAEGRPCAYLASTLLLRAQKRAVYLDHNEGHYALGTKAYCHFTSPIRRYPDDTVHRALKAYLAGKKDSREQQREAKRLPQLCRDCSELERSADAAARASQEVKMAELYAERIGESFSGIVSGVERFGVFVTLDDTCAEGLVPLRALGDGFFSYDEARMTLAAEDGGKVYQMGQRIAVTVHDVDTVRGRIGFVPASRDQRASR